jgi:fructuronate reductase
MTRLSATSLSQVPSFVRRPSFDRATCGVGILHLGIGAFHRAHQAVFTDDVLAGSGGDWAICGVSLRQATVQQQLAPQNGLYTLVERDAAGDACRIIGAVTECVYAPGNPEALIARMADPSIRIVSLTVTEKGYCLDPASGELMLEDPAIVRDLQNPHRPATAVGYLVAALALRWRAGQTPFTVLSCDNLPHNGRMLAGLVRSYAAELDPLLADWIGRAVAFPSSMVDRIVPATTQDDLAALSERLGLQDAAAVICEPFRQWVIEDHFTLGRPAWEAAGAQMVADVAPFEDMKLRLLNGSHSLLAYLGYLAGYETIAETMEDPAFERLVRHYMDAEATPTLALPPGVDLDGYKDQLITRFRNPALKHRTWQIAMDGSQKLPQRLLPVVRRQLALGGAFDAAALAVAAWMRYATGRDEQGAAIDVRDPLAERLASIGAAAGVHPAALVEACLGVREVFGADLPQAGRFRAAVESALVRLYEAGARQSADQMAKL